MGAPDNGSGGQPVEMVSPLQVITTPQQPISALVKCVRLIIDGTEYVAIQVDNAGGAATAHFTLEQARAFLANLTAIVSGLHIASPGAPAAPSSRYTPPNRDRR